MECDASAEGWQQDDQPSSDYLLSLLLFLHPLFTLPGIFVCGLKYTHTRLSSSQVKDCYMSYNR
jgi:hypothetical protein